MWLRKALQIFHLVNKENSILLLSVFHSKAGFQQDDKWHVLMLFDTVALSAAEGMKTTIYVCIYLNSKACYHAAGLESDMKG